MSIVLKCNKVKAVLEDIADRHGWSDYFYFFSNNIDWANHSGVCVKVFSPGMEEFLKRYKDSGIQYFNPAALKSDLPVQVDVNFYREKPEGVKMAELFTTIGWSSSMIYPSYSYGGMVGMIVLNHRDLAPTPEVVDATVDELNQWRAKFNAWARVLVENRKPHKIEEPLSARELDCMALVAEGMTSAEIAKELGISKRTVDFHIQNSVLKLGVSSRSQAALMLFLDPMPQLAMVSKLEAVDK
jgi:DNA-binding CsgD family transcriptional regulator